MAGGAAHEPVDGAADVAVVVVVGQADAQVAVQRERRARLAGEYLGADESVEPDGEPEFHLFSDDIHHLRETWLASVINNGTYEFGKDKVMAELQQILAAGILAADETKQLQTLQGELERGSNEHGVPFEFDCGEQECAVG